MTIAEKGRKYAEICSALLSLSDSLLTKLFTDKEGNLLWFSKETTVMVV
ncbi:hypothetical protein NXV12_31165 [Bacteroides thetaiotaomicron]|nr:hypothetical protein [Bacteroides thetaiotaomicron]